MAAVNIIENIFERENVNTYNDVKCRTVEEAVLQFTGNDAYSGQLVEVWNPETDETTYESVEESDGPISVSVLVNGKTESLDYEIKEDDIVFIIVLPSGGKSGASWLGAVIGLVVAVGLSIATYGIAGVVAGAAAGISANIGGIVIAGLAGAVAGYALGGAIYDMNHKDKTSSDAGEEGKSYPGVKGAKNQSLLGKPFPFVLGRHMITPPYIASPYTRSEGKYGEEQTLKILFAAGYSPLRLTNFKLGDLYLAYNKKTVNNPENHTVMHGRLKTANNDNLNTSYSWISCSQSEINELVAKKYLAEHKGSYDAYEYVDSSERYNHGVYSVYSGGKYYYRKKIVRNYVWYESKNDNIRVLNASIYNKGDVQRYTASTTMNGDTGEILHRWINNDVKLEILQQNEDSAVDYGTIYSDVIKQDTVNATPLYVVDDLINHVALENMISYKGAIFANGFRNNTVKFSRSNPMKIEVELEATNGLYRTYTHSDDGHSETRYESIPVYYAIQWRPYNTGNSSSFVEDWKNGSYEFNPIENPTGWRSFDFLNKYTDDKGEEHKIVPVKYTAERHNADIAAHTGNEGIGGASEGWIDCNVFDLGSLIDVYGGTDKDRVSMQRFTVEADLSALGAEWLRQHILGVGCTDTQKKHGMNTNSTVEVRVIRVSPSYINETGSSDEHNSAKQYSDVVKWNTISTFTFDEQKLSEQSIIMAEKVATENDMRKLCVIGLKVKADTGGNIQNQLSKFNCVAEAFAPTFDSDKNVWYPSDVHKITKYYEQPDFDINDNTEPDIDTSSTITKEQYELLRQNDTPALKRKYGNDFYSLLCRDIFKSENINTFTEDNVTYTRYFLDNETKDKYISANAASSTILSIIGRQNGIDALGYSDLNLMQFADMYEFCKQVSDGSTYPVDEIVELDDLGTIEHRAGDTVMIPYNCNAYITTAVKVENLMQKCMATARGIIVRDQENKIKPVIDREIQYPVMLINQQNTISGTNMITYDNVPAGLQFNYEDEDDENSAASLYVMDDGENYKNPTKEIETYSVDFVTNRHQLYSLGRYILGTRKLQREVLTRKVGIEGFCAEVGDLVDVQDDTLLIGTDLGARVREIIEDDDYIYGVVTDETFNFTGESITDETTGTVEARQGVELIQPTKYKASRVVSYRCALAGRKVTLSRVVIGGEIYNAAGIININGKDYYKQDNREERVLINGVYYDYYYDIESELYPVKNIEYEMTVGDTNVVIFDRKISKSGTYTPGAGYCREGVDSAPAQITYYKPEIDDIVAFGIVGKITSRFMITKIKPDKDFDFDLTLVQYNNQIYFAGDKLPVWAANITVPSRDKEDAFTLSESPSLAELQQVVTDTVRNVVKVIGDGTASNDKPDTPSIMSAAAEKDCIRLQCTPMSKGLKNSVIKANWQIYVWRAGDSADQSEWVWQNFDRVDGEFTSTSDIKAEYKFNRSKEVDGYPEKTDLVQDSKYYFRVQVVNSYNISSEWSAGALVSADSYGTWKLESPDVFSKVNDRTVILTIVRPQRADGLEVYGNIINKVSVTKPRQDVYYDDKRISESFDNEIFFKPATSVNPFDSEENYKELNLAKVYDENEVYYSYDEITKKFTKIELTATTFIADKYYTGVIDGFVECGETYTQVMPLINQDTESLQDTLYRFCVVSSNEAGDSPVSNNIYATALCTSISDLVKANENYKTLYVTMLSAISANIGTISQGAMGENANKWDLSSFPDEVGRNHHQGTFKVGGGDQYLHVIPLDEKGNDMTEDTPFYKKIASYRIEFKVGNFEVTSTASNINGELVVQLTPDSLDRALITETGIFMQHRNNTASQWINLAETSTNGIVTQQIYSQESLILSNQDIIQRRAENTDIGLQYLSDASKVYHFDSDRFDQNGNNDLVIADLEGTVNFLRGYENGAEYTPAILCKSPYSTLGKALFGQTSVARELGSATIFTIDFWEQFRSIEGQTLFNIGTPGDKLSLQIINAECYMFGWIGDEETPPKNDSPIPMFEEMRTAEDDLYLRLDSNKQYKASNVYYELVDGIYQYTTVTDQTYAEKVKAGLYEKSCNMFSPNTQGYRLFHTGLTSKESIDMRSVLQKLEINVWLHIAVVFTADKANVYFAVIDGGEPVYVIKEFNRYERTAQTVNFSINSDKISFMLDELITDLTVSEEYDDFKAHSEKRVPWGSLSDEYNDWFVFSAKNLHHVKSNLLTPTGTVISFAGSTAPAGYLLCNGQAVNRKTYSDLFTVIGETYGSGDGTTTFNVPNTVSGRLTYIDLIKY